MRKLFTLVALATVLSASATDYTGNLEVSINGSAVNQQAKITVEQQSDGLYTLQLHNFTLQAGDDVMPIGNIDLTNVSATTENGVTTLKFSDDITLTDGDDTSISGWFGPMLGPVPVDMIGELRNDKFYTVININMTSLDQVIRVTFGDGGYQIGNAGFEDFHTAKYGSTTSNEPNAWHSFQSATNDGLASMLASFALSAVHSEISTETRPGSTGSQSVKIVSTSVFSVIANGTITTGRINAGSATASDTKNHSFLDMSKTDVDGNGDPFYTTLNGQPDSLAVWVKFKQGTANADYPYATISAAITDGTYYQDPEDKTYSNVIAKAKNNTIESKDFAWQRISIPFTYNDVTDDMLNGTKALLVTISTNATPGKGSNGDELYVDDIELIYGNAVNDIKIKGNSIGLKDGLYSYDDVTYEGNALTEDDITVESDCKGVRITKEIVISDEESSNAYITVKATSADLKQSCTYKITAKKTTGISSTSNQVEAKTATFYNLAGQRINSAKTGQVVIKKYADGKTVKTTK